MSDTIEKLEAPRVTVVIPTLAADASIRECLDALLHQSFSRFVAVVVDNSGHGAAAQYLPGDARIAHIVNGRNEGFGEAVNIGFRAHPSEYLAVLNDDAVAAPDWLAALVDAMDRDADAGMAAACILQSGTRQLDSAGLRIALDGSSKQNGRNAFQTSHAVPGPALIPSGCAALYRKAMLDEIGMFESSFFLYCEDTDLALRGHWAGWTAVYAPDAVVDHRYSVSAGRASPLKAYLVERNRLRVVARCLPWTWALRAPFASAVRYFWHAVFALRGTGKAGEFVRGASPLSLPWIVVKAHLALLASLPRLLRERRAILRRVAPRAFSARLQRHRIPLREVAAQ